MVTRCKTLIICASMHHGNTARVARAMADVLAADVASPRIGGRRDPHGWRHEEERREDEYGADEKD